MQDNADIVLKYAESQGIEIPADEDAALEDAVDGGAAESRSGSLAAAIEAEASRIVADASASETKQDSQSNLANTALADTDGLGLGRLIEESLQKSSSPQAGSSTNGTFESTGLASFITQKLGQNSDGPSLSSQYQSSVNTATCKSDKCPAM